MRIAPWLALVLALVALAAPAGAADRPQWHTVADGQTLGKIAKRYSVSVEALCSANEIRRQDPIKPGQKLVIPAASDKDGKDARRWRASRAPAPSAGGVSEDPAPRAEQQVLEVAGVKVYYYEPTGPGRLTLRPVLLYLHGRGGSAQAECRRWAPVARRLGWLVCPSGPEARENGGHGWDNNWPAGQRIATGAVTALRERYGRRVQLYGNTIIGFSEGAYVAMNVGVREPRTFNRWLILAAHTRYWGGAGVVELQKNRGRIRRVYLITGREDGVHDATLDVRQALRKAGVAVRVSTPDDMGHVVALETKRDMYEAALVWLSK